MIEKRFLSKETRIFSLVVSVIFTISILSLIIMGLVTGLFQQISIIGSSILLFLSAIFMGAMQIKVFADYKSQKKYLCADGIFYICLTILVGISVAIYFSVPSSKIDLRILMFVFIAIFALWKFIIAILNFKNKAFNAWVEILIGIFWLCTGVSILLTMKPATTEIASLTLSISNYTLCVTTIFYILFSYVFKAPDFLITEKAQMLLDKEYEQKVQRLNRIQSRLNPNIIQVNTTNEKSREVKKPNETVEEKLTKLTQLKEKGFITEEEFKEQKKAILDEEF